MGQCVKQNRNTKHAAHAHAASPRTMGTLSHGFRSYCLHLMPKVNLPHNTALMSPALALPSHLGSARRYLRMELRAKSHVALSPPARHSRQAYPSQGPRAPRPHSAHSYSTEAAVVRAAATLPPRHACQGWPHACRLLAARGTVYRHAIICGVVARITIATRPPRAAPTRHVTIRGCAPGTPGASSLVP